MKIQSLHIKNIASIVEATINFDKGILAAEPIFLICGETGSGKTTILNAICLALYKKVPYFDTVGDDEKGRTNTAKRKIVDDWLDNAIQLDQIKNPEQLLRRGAKIGEASLSFIGNDGHSYTATWEAHPNQMDKTKTKSTHRLYDNTANITYSAVNDIKKAVEQAVGLNFEQFCRTTMLAQGQFSKFICAKDDEKEAILEKLTATERFSVYGASIHEKYIQVKRQYDILAAVINETHLLSDDEIDSANKHLKRLNEQIDANTAAGKSAKAKTDWLDRQSELHKSQAAELTKIEALQAQRVTPEFAAQASLIRDWDATVAVRADIAVRRKEQLLLNADKEKLSNLGAKAVRLLNGVEWMKQHGASLQNQADECRKAVDAFKDYKPMIDDSAALLRELDNLSELFKLLKEQASISSQLQKKLEHTSLLYKCQEDARQKAADNVKSCKEKEEESAKKASGIDLTEFDSKIKEVDEKKALLLNAKMTLQAFIDNSKKAKETQIKLDNADNDITDYKDRIKKLSDAMPALDAEATKLRGEYQGKLDLKNALTSIRLKFAETHECPLCGSAVEHLHTDDMLDASIAESLDKSEKAQADANAAKSAIAQCKGNLKALKESCKSLEKELKETNQRRNDAEDLLASNFKDCPHTLQEIDEQSATTDQRRKEIASRREKASADIAAHNEAMKRLGEANDTLLKAEKQAQKTSEAIAKQKAEIKASDDAIEAIKHDISRIKMYLQKYSCDAFADINTINDCSLAKETVNKNVSDYNKAAAEKEGIDTKIKLNDDAISNCEGMMSRLHRFFPDAQANDCIKVKGVDKALTDLLQEAASLQGSMETTKRNITDAQSRIDEYFLRPDCVAAQRVDALAATPETDYLDARKAEQQLSDAENRSKGALEQLGKDIAAHDAKRPEITDEDSPEALAEKIKEIETAINSDREKMAEIKQRLMSDKETRQRLQSQITEKDKMELLRDKWLTLDRLYGGEKGVNFRRIAQIHVLANLLQRANYFMRDLDDRYRLTSSGMSLNIYVTDRHIDAAPRAVNSLSGGEGFLASLALALALSTISKERIDIDILFIDEGFGTLSPGPLDKAMNTLRKLSHSGNRRVGIISHVEALRSIVPAKIQLERTSESTSRLTITDH